MANLTINGTNYGPLNSGFTGPNETLAAGMYFCLEPYGQPPRVGSKEQEEMLVTFVGVDGIGGKQCGYRGQSVSCEMLVADSTKAGTEGRIETFQNGLPTNVRVDVTPPGGAAIHGCKLVRGSARPARWVTIDSMVCAVLQVELRSWSTSN